LELHLSMNFFSRSSEAGLMIAAWQLFPILFIPLFITGWQYSFRTILLFCLGTALFDLVLSLILVEPGQPLLFRAIFGVVFIRTSAFILVGYMVVKLMATQRRLRQALAQTNTRLAQYAGTLEQLATSRERNRLARELHDVVAHSLSGAAVELEAVKVLWDTEPVQAQAMLDQSLNTIRSGLTETRRALKALRATPLEDLGLALAVRHLAESTASRAGVQLDLDIAEQLSDYPADIEQCVYRVAAEALANAVEHAQARHISVQLAQNNGQLCLSVSDDGTGFDPQRIDQDHSYGLKGMQERAEMAGGRFSVQSRPGAGTTVSLTLERQHGESTHL
jgi:signal transduction histidine kinase